MRIRFLGTGTSSGVPLIGCRCNVCTSSNPKNKRLRCSLTVETATTRIIIDAGPDLRQQLLRAEISHVDAVLFTHAHGDHVHGIDDLKNLGTAPLPCYASPQTAEEIATRFAYLFEVAAPTNQGRPSVVLHALSTSLQIGDLQISPVPIEHGPQRIYGYRIGDVAYLTDCSRIPDASYDLLSGISVLIIDALRYEPHEKHFTIGQATTEAIKIGAARTYFIHMAHQVDHDTANATLPKGVSLAYDMLDISL